MIAAFAPAATAQAAFPGPNGKIAFQTTRDGPRPQIWTMNPDGSRQTNVTRDHLSPYEHPAWSADGTQLAFARSGEVFVMGADGSAPRQVTTGGCFSCWPAWAPRGQQLAFTRDWDIFVVGVDGGEETRLTSDPRTDLTPAWSPSGAEIAFAGERGDRLEVMTMAPNGLGQVNRTNAPGRDVAPNWSPDGSRIAFTSDRDGNDEIYVMDADGSDQTRLTNHSASDADPAWSPDGTMIAFASRRAGPDADIYVMNADGSNVRRLTIAAGHDLKPDWGPDLTPPAEPTLVRTDPPSPSNYGEPRVVGRAEVDSTVRIYHDADCTVGPAATGPASEFETRGLPVRVIEEGSHTFHATATDLAGHVSECSTESVSYVLDLTMPHTTIDSGPAEGEQTSERRPVFTFSANEPVARFECGLDGSQLAECSSPYAPEHDLADGDHTFVVRAVDLAGNAEDSPAVRSFVVRPAECSNVWVPLPDPLPALLPPEAPDAVCG